MIAAGIGTLVILGLLGTFFRKALITIALVGVYAGVLSSVIMIIVMATTSQATFVSNFNAYAAPLTDRTDYYHALISLTHSNYTGTTLSQTIAFIPLAAYIFMYC